MDSEQIESKINWSIGVAVAVVVVAVGGYLCWFGYKLGYSLSSDSTIWGAFGDFVGGLLNPLVAFLALYWLITSVRIQRSELESIRDEMNEAKEAAKAQAAASKAQAEMMKEKMAHQARQATIEFYTNELNYQQKRLVELEARYKELVGNTVYDSKTATTVLVDAGIDGVIQAPLGSEITLAKKMVPILKRKIEDLLRKNNPDHELLLKLRSELSESS